MVARSAYAQLRYSPLLLVLTVIGMVLVFLAPPLLTIFAVGPERWLGAADWIAMAGAYVPILRFYRAPVVWSVALPLIASVYLAFTLDSAYQHARWSRRAVEGPRAGDFIEGVNEHGVCCPLRQGSPR